MRKITVEEIQKTIYSNRLELISSYIAQGQTEIPYNLANFEKDMLVSELVVDPKTIRTKWKLLIASGTVRETSERLHRGILSIPALSSCMSDPMARRLSLIIKGGERGREICSGADE